MRREFVRQCFYFFSSLLPSALLCFNETERNFAESRFDFDWISKYTSPLFSLSLSFLLFLEQYKVVSFVGEIKIKLLKICHNKPPQWRQRFSPSLSFFISISVLPCWLLLFVVVFVFLLKLFQIAMEGGETTLMDHIVGLLLPLAARHFYCEFRHH